MESAQRLKTFKAKKKALHKKQKSSVCQLFIDILNIHGFRQQGEADPI